MINFNRAIQALNNLTGYSMFTRYLCLSVLVVVSLNTITVEKAFAAEHDDDKAEGNQLEEVIVQALRRDDSLQSVPIAVTAVSQKSLDKSDIVDITDLNNIIPNLVIQTPNDQANTRIFLRGVGTVNGTEAGDQSVGYYIDGIFAARAQGALALFYDLENIQLLRGPQGTLFGRNNSAGALLVKTKRPSDEFEGDIELTTGSFNRRRASAGVSIPINDSWGLRLAGIVDIDEGWVDQITVDPRFPEFPDLTPEGGEASIPYSRGAVNRFADPNLKLNNRDSRSVRLSSLASMGEITTWFLSVEFFNNKSADSVLLNPVWVEDGRYEAYIDSPHSLDLDSTAIRSVFTVAISETVDFELLSGISNLYRAQVHDADAGWIPSYLENRTEWQRSRAYSNELKFSGIHGDGAFEWTAGIYGFYEQTGIRFDIDGTNAWPEGAATFIQPERGAESLAAYAQFTYRPVDSLGITLGLRNTDEKKFDRRGRNYTNFCNGFQLRPNPVPASRLNGGNEIAVAEDFFNNTTGVRTRNLDGSAVMDAAGNALVSDGIDDNTGKVIPVFVDEVNNDDNTVMEPDGLHDVTGEPNSLLCVAGTQNELERDYTELSWLFRVDYTLSGTYDTLFYISAATGYQSGVIQDNGNSTLPETSLSYEFGTKTDFGGFRINTALFYNNYSDLIRSLIDPVQNNTIVTNASEAEIFGLEVELTSVFGSGGQLDAGLSYLNATYTGEYLFADTGISEDLPQGTNPSLPIVILSVGSAGEPRSFYDLNGSSLPYAPEIQFNLGFSWAFNFEGGSLTPRIRAIYSAEFFFNDRNTQIAAINVIEGGQDRGLVGGNRTYHTGNPEGQDAYFKTDLGLEWASVNGWSLDLYINNLTDELVKTSANCTVGTTEGCIARYLPPTETGLRFRWQF